MSPSRPGSKPLPDDRQSRARLAAQLAILQVLVESATITEASSRLLRAVCEGLGWEFGAVWRVGKRGNVLHCVETWRRRPGSLPDFETVTRSIALRMGVELPGRVWESGEPLWVEDVTRDPDFPRAPIAAREGLHGAFALPMRLGGEMLGAIEFFSGRVEPRDDELLRTMANVGGEVSRLVLRRRDEEELQHLFALSRDMLCISGFDGYFKRLNPAWESTLGWTLEELMATPYLDFVHPEDRERTLEEAGRITSGDEPVEFANRYRCKDGSYRWLAWKSAAAAGRRTVFSVARDITERIRTAEQLERARAEAEASSRAKSQFLAHVSHEIRTPMNAVIGMTELALDTRLNREQRDYITAVKDSAETLLSLINDLLDLSKIEAGKLALDQAAFDLRDTVTETARTLAHRARAQGLELVCHVRPEVPAAVVGDAVRLRQVLYNLVGNAIKFTPRGEVVVRVELEAEAAHDLFLRFTVSDTGIGIPVEKLGRIFEAFEQADASTTRVYGGTGLGLSIASQLVEMMGGRIAVESEPGRGSTFRFTVRFGRTGVAAAAPAEANPLRGLPVLLVEDHPALREMLIETLEGWGLRPTAAPSGAEAGRALERSRFPVVVIDAEGPGPERFDLAEQLRRDPRHAKSAVILLVSPERSRGLRPPTRTGAVLTKPVRHSEFLDALMAGTGSRRPSGPKRARTAARKASRALRVLVAEDSPTNRTLIARLLEKRGHRPQVVGDGAAALHAIEQGGLDAVLMDVRMPGMDGLEATRRVRERERGTGRRVPIVAITAEAMKGDRERCLEAGMDDYLTKPIDAVRLFEILEGAASGAGGAKVRAGAGAASAGAALDQDAALARVGGDRDLLAEVVEIHLADAPVLLERLRAAVAAGDAQALREAAHAYKGAAANFGATAAVEAAKALEGLARGGELAGAPEALARLEVEAERLREALVAHAHAAPQRR